MVTMIDGGRLAAILVRLPPNDAEWLTDQLEPAWARRARRLQARDEAVRTAARRFYPGMAPTPCAAVLATAIDRYLATTWPRERDIAELRPEASALRTALHLIAWLNEGRSIGARQIRNVLGGTRGR
jgi:hypothetical protein